MKHEYFRGLASDDARFRLDHAHEVATAILGLFGLDPTVINAVECRGWQGHLVPHARRAQPALAEISELKPEIRCVSPGRSGLFERLSDILCAKPLSELLCLEGRHADRQTPDVGGRQPGAPKKLG